MSMRPINELKKIYDEDRYDRIKKLWERNKKLFLKRDHKRLKRVLTLVRRNKLSTAADHLHAAMILQHGGKTKYYRMAHKLAKKSADMGYKKQKGEVDPLWLAAAAKDRALMSQGKPQRYGTQFKKDSKGGKWYLYSVDPAVTDKERARWHVRPLREAKKTVKKLNKN